MKETTPTLVTIFDKVDMSELPNWAKTIIAVFLTISPLLEWFFAFAIVSKLTNLVEKLLGL
jgi:phosphate/sulfate permease